MTKNRAGRKAAAVLVELHLKADDQERLAELADAIKEVDRPTRYMDVRRLAEAAQALVKAAREIGPQDCNEVRK